MNELVIRRSQSAPLPPAGYDLVSGQVMQVTNGRAYIFGVPVPALDHEFDDGFYHIIKIDYKKED